MQRLEETYLNKHVAAIHCSNNIGLLQRKIFNVLLYKAYDRLLKDDFHYISFSELSKLTGYNSNDTAKLKRAFKTLQSANVEWNIIENNDKYDKKTDNEIWCSSTLLASTVIDVKRGLCRYEYSKTLAVLLYQPEIYARIDLNLQNKFRTSYGLALYENCVRFKNVKTTGWIEINKFRKLMGVDDSKYPQFRDFNRRVLLSAIDEINNTSDINIDLQLNRVSQQVMSLKFNITNKKITKSTKTEQDLPIDSIKENTLDLRELLKNKFSAAEKDINNMINSYPADFINEKIQLIFSSESYKKGRVIVPLAFLKSALKNNYSASKQLTEKNKVELTEAQKEEINWRMYRVDYYRYITGHMMKEFIAASEEGQNKALSDFFTNGKVIVDNFSQDEHWFSTVYKKLGNSADSLKLAVLSEAADAAIFFERGFTEFLYKKYKNLKESAPLFKEFMALKI